MAVTTPTMTSSRPLESDKAKRIVDAMRESVARRGSAGSTFDHVAREAGVSRGLLHYYFGTKERLLVEVVRRDSEIRLGTLAAALGVARTADDFIDALVRSLEQLIEDDPGFVVLMHELFTLSRRNEEIAGELATLARVARADIAASLKAKQDEGVVRLGDRDADLLERVAVA
ncbi:MAG TPA: TetR family transcriptional regulator, partial [Conexibacter sp.]|nr:TetR family transcriptional regulator [Conexibacter sp.]